MPDGRNSKRHERARDVLETEIDRLNSRMRTPPLSEMARARERERERKRVKERESESDS